MFNNGVAVACTHHYVEAFYCLLKADTFTADEQMWMATHLHFRLPYNQVGKKTGFTVSNLSQYLYDTESKYNWQATKLSHWFIENPVPDLLQLYLAILTQRNAVESTPKTPTNNKPNKPQESQQTEESQQSQQSQQTSSNNESSHNSHPSQQSQTNDNCSNSTNDVQMSTNDVRAADTLTQLSVTQLSRTMSVDD